jgi:hypothetical protein
MISVLKSIVSKFQKIFLTLPFEVSGKSTPIRLHTYTPHLKALVNAFSIYTGVSALYYVSDRKKLSVTAEKAILAWSKGFTSDKFL